MLSIGLTFFVRDVWNDFQEEKTNDRVYSKSINSFRHPTIAICFEPQINETSLILKYNKTLKDLNIETSAKGMQDMTVPVATVLEEVSFKLGRDYSLLLMLSGHESDHDYIRHHIKDRKVDKDLMIAIVLCLRNPTDLNVDKILTLK